jgi:competence protein ComEC
LALAVYLASYAAGLVVDSGWLLYTALLLGLALLLFFRRKAGLPRLALAILTALALAGLLRSSLPPPTLPENHISAYLPSAPVTLMGWVAEEPNISGRFSQVRLRAEWLEREGLRQAVSGDCLITLPPGISVRYGQSLILRDITLSKPSGYSNPGSLDYGKLLARRRIFVIGRVASEESLEVIPGRHPESSRLFWQISLWRGRMLKSLEEALPGDPGALLEAIVLGARERLSRRVRQHFRLTGTAHLLAISGLHVGFIAGAAFWSLRGIIRLALRLAPEPLGLRLAPSRWAAAGTIPAVLFYALLVGARVATVRASIMIVIYLAARLCRSTRNNFHALALAALVILLRDPDALEDIGFQLSFAAVTAILLALRWIDRREKGPLPSAKKAWWERLARKIGTVLLVSVVASAATWPLIARIFHRLALIAPLANALVVPLASLTIPLGLAACLSSILVPGIDGALFAVAGWGARALLAILQALARLPHASIVVSAPPGWFMAAYYGLLASLLLWPRSQRKKALALATAFILAISTTIGIAQAWRSRNRLKLTALDAGRAQVFLINLPDQRNLLWLGLPPGSSPRVVKRVVIPALLHLRTRTIHGLIAASHSWSTARSVSLLSRHARVKEIWFSPGSNGSPPLAFREMMASIAPFRLIEAGWSQSCGMGCTIRGLWPVPEMTSKPGEATGPVIHIRFGKRAILLMGENSSHVEEALLAGERDLRANVLQIPKSASRYASSKAFIQRVSPQVALLATHPPKSWLPDVAQTLLRYRAVGIEVWRVDQRGAVTWETNGKWIDIRAFKSWDQPVSAPSMLLAERLEKDVRKEEGPADDL